MNAQFSGKYELLDKLAEEFAERFRRGERPSLQEYIDRHPDLADDIRELFPAMVEMERGEIAGGPAAPPLRQVGDYRILREVGHGGMGVVYEAEQGSLGRRVALKVLPGHATHEAKALERFRREARAAARLHHTNIVPVFDVGQAGGLCFYAMQFIQGQGLDQVLQELQRLRADSAGRGGQAPTRPPEGTHPPADRLAQSLLTGQFAAQDLTAGLGEPPPRRDPSTARPEPDAASSAVLPGKTDLSSVQSNRWHYFRSVARIGQQVAGALAYAHARGIVHRDVKPSNLLLDASGVVWITDFGLAKTEEDGLTQTGDLLGTFRYMAPERFQGKGDARADLYALGLTLYELLVLRPAFDAPDRAQLMKQVQEVEPPRPGSLDPRIPRDLETIVLKAIAKAPERRYQSAEDLAEDLRRFLDGEPIRARRTGPLERGRLWCRRHPALAGLYAVLLAAVGGLSLLGVYLYTALEQSEANRKRKEEAEARAKAKLWEAYLAQARATRVSRRPGQRFDSLRAIREALRLPLPEGRSLAELRTEAIAALCLPDLEVAVEWGGLPPGANGVVVDPAFERYAWGDKDGNVSVRRVRDNEELYRLPTIGRCHDYAGLLFSPDGRFLHVLTAAERGCLWKLDGPQAVKVLDDNHMRSAFSPDSRQWAACYPDHSIRLLDLESGRVLRRFEVPEVNPWICWNPRRPQLAVALSSGLQVLHLDSGRFDPPLPHSRRSGWMAWHPEGRVIAYCRTDLNQFVLADCETRAVVGPTFEGHRTGGVVTTFNHTGDRLVSTDWSGLWRLWDVRTGQQLCSLPAGGPALAFRRDDQGVAIDATPHHVRLYRHAPGREFATLPHSHGGGRSGYFDITAVPLLRDGRLTALQVEEGLALVDLGRLEEVGVVPLPGASPVPEIAGATLLTSGGQGVLRWPVQHVAGDRSTVQIGPPALLDAFHEGHASGAPDGKVIALAAGWGARIIRPGDGKSFNVGPQDDVRGCAVSPDGRWIATGSHGLRSGPGCKVWDAVSGRPVANLPVGGGCPVWFSPDSKWLVTGSGTHRIWEVGSWREGPALASAGHVGCAFSADGKLLALDDVPGVVRLVDPGTGREVARLTAPAETRLLPRTFTPDGGKLLMIGRESGALHVFDLRAIRAGLRELGLDWDPAGPLPGRNEGSPTALPDPLRIKIELGDQLEKAGARPLFAQADRFLKNKDHAGALAALCQAVRAAPNKADAHNSLAWLLVTAPAELRDPAQALAHARRAVELSGRRDIYLNTLGVVLYRNGQFAEAVPVLEKSYQAGKGQQDAFDLFFLAMCHHQLGDPKKAREEFDGAARWFRENRTRLHDPSWEAELTAFQAEAEALLKQPPRRPAAAR
jgi:serine/threonine protein kinase/WD40 repeat protein